MRKFATGAGVPPAATTEGVASWAAEASLTGAGNVTSNVGAVRGLAASCAGEKMACVSVV